MRGYATWGLGMLVLLSGLSIACCDEARPRICDPGFVQSCPCSGGRPDGTQACSDDGTMWGACDCVDSWPDGDGDVDADGDADADMCAPECTDRQCGPDGCGGECGPGCGEDALCHEASGACLAGWLEAAFSVDRNPDENDGTPSTDAFDPIEGIPLVLRASFETSSVERSHEEPSSPFDDEQWTVEVSTGPLHLAVEGDGATALDDLVSDLEGQRGTMVLQVTDERVGGFAYDLYFNVDRERAGTYFHFWISCWDPELEIDLEGYPILSSLSCSGGIHLIRGEGSTLTDHATGPMEMSVYLP